MARFPIISTASCFSTRTARRREAGATCCAGRRSALARRRAKWPAWAPSPYADRPPARVEGASCAHVLCRPCELPHSDRGPQYPARPGWSKRASPFRWIGPKRVNDPGIAFADLPPIDAVLVSHGHYDHLDLATLSRLAGAHRPRVITPLGNDAIMRDRNPTIAAEALRLGRSRRSRRGRCGHPRSRRSIGRRATCPTATCRYGPHSSSRRRPDASITLPIPATATAAFPPRARAPRPAPARHSADRRLRAALVHARAAHESGRIGAGFHRLRRRACAWPSLRHVPAHRRSRSTRRSSRLPRRCRPREFRPNVSARCGPGRRGTVITHRCEQAINSFAREPIAVAEPASGQSTCVGPVAPRTDQG